MRPKHLALLALVFAAGILSLKVCSLDRKADALQAGVLAFSSSPSPPAPTIPPDAAKTKEEADAAAAKAKEEADRRRHHESVSRCNMQGGIPVLGYGWKVVCLKKSAYDWVESPKDGHDPAGL
jgi:hypothetical protein